MTLAIATLLVEIALGADVGVKYYQWNQLQKGTDAVSLAQTISMAELIRVGQR
jgi:hypothetical protein